LLISCVQEIISACTFMLYILTTFFSVAISEISYY
jgi:hypothetical protein